MISDMIDLVDADIAQGRKLTKASTACLLSSRPRRPSRSWRCLQPSMAVACRICSVRPRETDHR